MKEVLIMELIKALPEIFEEFAEQRQRSFLVMKEVKDPWHEGKKAVPGLDF